MLCREAGKGCRGKCWAYFAVAIAILSVSVGGSLHAGKKGTDGASEQSLWQRSRLGGELGGVRPAMEKYGVSAGLGLTQVYQHNLHGGLEPGVGGYAASYDLELEVDTGQALGLEGGHIYMLGEGGTTFSDGVDARAVGSLFGINDDLAGERTLDITELWYQHEFFGGDLRFRLGKMDLTNGFSSDGRPAAFDGNAYANDEVTQFLNSSLVNNPVIPFPDYALGLSVYGEPVEGWDVSAGGVDAEADPRLPGFETTFDGDSNFFYVAETGLTPVFSSPAGGLPGAYRLGAWHENNPRPYLDRAGEDGENTGFYASVDQLVWRESGGSGSPEGLGVFGRMGWADPDVGQVETFTSAGLQYRGLLPGRPADTAALGVSSGEVSEHGAFTADYERAAELYYSAELAPWLHVTPAVQYIEKPGASADADDAWVLGTRLQATF